MTEKFYELELDTDISVKQYNTINTNFLYRRDNRNTNFITVKILNKGVPVDLKDTGVILLHKKGDNDPNKITPDFYKIDPYVIPKENIKDNVVVVPLPFQEKDEVGIRTFRLFLIRDKQYVSTTDKYYLCTKSYTYELI